VNDGCISATPDAANIVESGLCSRGPRSIGIPICKTCTLEGRNVSLFHRPSSPRRPCLRRCYRMTHFATAVETTSMVCLPGHSRSSMCAYSQIPPPEVRRHRSPNTILLTPPTSRLSDQITRPQTPPTLHHCSTHPHHPSPFSHGSISIALFQLPQ
jgi:hypothetical protein